VNVGHNEYLSRTLVTQTTRFQCKA